MNPEGAACKQVLCNQVEDHCQQQCRNRKAERSTIMEDPNFYLDAEHAGLVREFSEAGARLEELGAAWEKAGTKLEAAERAFDATEAAD